MGKSRSFLTIPFLRRIFPEYKWDELDSTSYEVFFNRLKGRGTLSAAAAEYIQAKNIKMGFFKQYKSGAGWTLMRNITLDPKADLNTPLVLSLIGHEVCHLQQTLFMRLSVCGELLAWQHQKRIYFEISGQQIGDPGEAYAGTREHWEALSQLTADSREDLGEARNLMQRIAPGYRAHCLPLYPLFKEIGFHLKKGKFKESLIVVRKLVACK